jgi:hypothetical protein
MRTHYKLKWEKDDSTHWVADPNGFAVEYFIEYHYSENGDWLGYLIEEGMMEGPDVWRSKIHLKTNDNERYLHHAKAKAQQWFDEWRLHHPFGFKQVKVAK